jgi:hypothetical protein
MPRILSSAFHREIDQLTSASSLVWLFQLDIPNAPLAFRVANWPEPVVFSGLSFEAFGVEIDRLEDASSQSLVHLRCAFQNVDQQLSALLEYYWHPDALWQVLIWQIDVTQPDTVAYADAQVTVVAQISTRWRDAVADLVAEFFSLGATVPKRRFTSMSGFRYMPRRIGF